MLRPVTDLSNDALHSSLNPVIEQRYRRLSIHSGASSLNAVRSLVSNSASDGRGRSALWPARRHVSLLSCRSGPVRGGGMAAEEAPAAGYTGSVPIPLRRRSVIDLIRMACCFGSRTSDRQTETFRARHSGQRLGPTVDGLSWPDGVLMGLAARCPVVM